MMPPPLPPSALPVDDRVWLRCRSRLAFLGAVLAVGVHIAIIANWLAPVGVRLPSGALNITVLLVALLLPSVALVLLVWLGRGVGRVVGVTLVTLFALPSFFLAALITLWLGPGGIRLGDDPGFVRLHDTKAGRYHVVIYRTDGGATTAYGICVRQELPLRLGLRLVREIYRSYPADDATVDVLAPDTVRVTADNYRNPDAKTFELQPLVSF